MTVGMNQAIVDGQLVLNKLKIVVPGSLVSRTQVQHKYYF